MRSCTALGYQPLFTGARVGTASGPHWAFRPR
jgi:hypothetical protein